MRWASVPSPAHRLAVLRLAERAALANPDRPSVQLVRAEALDAVGRREEALTLLASAVERFPEEEPLHSGYAGALMKAGRIEAALEQVRPWIPNRWAQKLQFRLLMRSGRPEAAAELEA